MSDTSTAHQVGDIVIVSDDRALGLYWKVVRVNDKTYSIDEVNADGTAITGRKPSRTRAAKELVHKPAKPGQPIGQPYKEIPHYVCGQIVRYTGTRTIAGFAPGDIGIVLADKGRLVNVAKLGGHNDSYLRAPHSHLEPLTPAELAAELAGQPAPAPAPEPEPRPALVQVPVPGQPANAGILKGWLRDVPDSTPVLISRDDAGNTHAGLAAHTGAIAIREGGQGFQTALWDGEHQNADLLDLIQAENGQRVLVLVPQV